MDGTALAIADATMAAALSVFGVVLFADAAAGMAEMTRVLRPGGTLLLLDHGPERVSRRLVPAPGFKEHEVECFHSPLGWYRNVILALASNVQCVRTR